MLWQNPFAKADSNQNNPQSTNVQTVNPNPGAGKGGKQQSGTIPDGGPNKDDPNADPDNNDGSGDDPLLQFDSLWEPNKDKDGNPVDDSSGDSDDGYMPKVDPKKFGELLQKMDFTKSIGQEEWAALSAGGEGSVKAMQSILNKSNRHAFATMFNAMSRMTESGIKNAHSKFSSGVPDIVRDFMTEDGLVGGEGTSSIMKNPAFAPMVKQVKNQYLKKFPKATPSQVNGAVKQYFDYMAKELSGQTKTKGQLPNNQDKLRRGEPEADFLQWIESEVGGLGGHQDNSDAEDN